MGDNHLQGIRQDALSSSEGGEFRIQTKLHTISEGLNLRSNVDRVKLIKMSWNYDLFHLSGQPILCSDQGWPHGNRYGETLFAYGPPCTEDANEENTDRFSPFLPLIWLCTP